MIAPVARINYYKFRIDHGLLYKLTHILYVSAYKIIMPYESVLPKFSSCEMLVLFNSAIPV